MKRLGIGAAILALAALGVVAVRWWRHVNVAPEPPTAEAAPFVVPATSSHLAVTVSCPKASLVSQLENAIPRSLRFDITQNGTRVYGSPSRGPIEVKINVPAGPVTFSTTVSGHVQVERRVKVNLLVTRIDRLLSVGINFTAHASASLAPVLAPNWTVDPRLSLSAHADRVVASTFLGGIDVTGHVQGGVANALNSVQAAANTKLKEVLDVRGKVERLWNEVNSVHELTKDPPTWLRLTPRKASFGRFQYTSEAINSGLAIDLETRVFVQDSAPPALKSPLPALQVNAPLSDDFQLSIPIEVSYGVINEQLKARLTKNPLALPDGVSLEVKDVGISPYGDGVLLTLDFSASKGWFRSASGRLYVVGIPRFDAAKAELRVEKLDFSVATKNFLIKSADWLLHGKILEEVKGAAVVNLEGELKKAAAKANEKLAELKKDLPKEVGANVSVTKVGIEGLTFTRERAFALVTADGKMSAQLQP
jgi:hypothetical protein